jgi:hypothetical protein
MRIIMKTNMNHKSSLPTFAIWILTLLLPIVTALGCDEEEEETKLQTVSYEVNGDADFELFQTFGIVDPMTGAVADGDAGTSDEDAGVSDDPFGLSDINSEILAEIETQLTGVGLDMVTENPDLLVTYYANKDKQTDPVTFYTYYYGPYWGYEYTWTTDVTYEAGTLVIDVVDVGPTADVDDDVLVYHGVAEGVLGEDPGVQLLQVRNAVYEIFKGWPEQ